MTAAGVLIWLDKWLKEEDHTINEYRAKAGIKDGGSHRRGLIDEDIVNMCNKTYAVPLSHLGSDIHGREASPRSTGSTSSKKGPLWTLLIIRHPDICTMFLPVAWICTPRKLATEQALEDKIAVQAKEELVVAGWVQALWEKFAMAANNKFATAKEKEVCWVADPSTYSTKAPNAIMEEAAPHPVFPEFSLKSRAVKSGSKHRVSTRLERMSAQIKEQERIADTTSALALSLRNTGQLPGHQTSPLLPVHAPDPTPVEMATPVQQVSSTRTLASDLATLWQDLLLHSPARPLDATPSHSTADSLVSGLSSLTPSAVEQESALNASNYSSVPHNCLPVNEVDNLPGQDMFPMAHRTVLGSCGHFWFLQVGINYLPNQD